MRTAAEKLLKKHYGKDEHPYHTYEKLIFSRVGDRAVVLDAGCGATAPVLVKLIGKARELIGVDLVDFDASLAPKGLKLYQRDLRNLQIPPETVDLIISRSVLEHVQDVESVYREFHRVLKPGGKVILLVPNLWDYTSLLSWIIPNRFHQLVVRLFTGRRAEDTFPTYYRSNTRGDIQHLSRKSGFTVDSLEYHGQYPYMLEFCNLLFRLGIYYDRFICRHSSLQFLRGWILCELSKSGVEVAA